MTTAKLNIQHEYITLRTVWSKGCTMNLTTSYSGEKCTARGVEGGAMKRVWQAFLQHRKLIGDGKLFKDNGEQMEALRKLAETSTDPVNFAVIIETNIAVLHGVDPVKVVEIVEKAIPTPTPAVVIAEPTPPSNLTLEQAFDLVKNKKDWKARIDARINKADEARVLEAIIHFTGTAGYTLPHPTNPDKIIVRAKGYRMGPCGDQ